MKIKLLFLFLALTVSTYAQKPAVRIFYGFSDAEFLHSDEIDGSSNDEVKNYYELGAEISIPLNTKFSLITGVTFSKLKTSGFYEALYSYNASVFNDTKALNSVLPVEPYQEKQLDLLSIPILLEFKFWNYFFLNAGPVLSFELNDPDIEYSQNGIGYNLGFGGQYNFGDFFVFANPYFKQFGTIDFKDEMLDYNLSQFGAHVGIGYQF
ncbi:hypothetical protein [Zunongwangia atlantica]|uniref:Outer membrane protein beta-barrel domain-containing protein n=1 Tax=Zunongwangia atlantica 22II14-10F7 TaxID=1185767 RepID=A0A1Y1T5W2_9FLAO|nr:hypothetical protein [Zunongwangia atlantica]ORL46430.1 hypothetical protein IIF7_05282 [Zunongwangia atlantica 22II14-10F7]